MKYIILISIGMIFLWNESDNLFNVEPGLNTWTQKTQMIEVFMIKDSLYAKDAHLIRNLDSINMQVGIDSLSLFLRAPSSSGFMWTLDTVKSDLKAQHSEYLALSGKNDRKNFQKFNFVHTGCWDNKNVTVYLTRPFDPALSPKDSCIIQIRQNCEQ